MPSTCYTDKRTTLFAPERSLTLDAGKECVLRFRHDQTNKICQCPSSGPGPRARLLHREIGFTIITDQPFDDKQRWIELRVPKAETRVVLFTTDEDKNRIGTFMNMSYTCEDLQKTYEDLKKRGVEFENPPKKEHWGNFAIFRDSEGNRFVLGD